MCCLLLRSGMRYDECVWHCIEIPSMGNTQQPRLDFFGLRTYIGPLCLTLSVSRTLPSVLYVPHHVWHFGEHYVLMRWSAYNVKQHLQDTYNICQPLLIKCVAHVHGTFSNMYDRPYAYICWAHAQVACHLYGILWMCSVLCLLGGVGSVRLSIFVLIIDCVC